MVIRLDILPCDVAALGLGLVLFNWGALIWFGYPVGFIARALRLEGETGRRFALTGGRWLTFLGALTLLMPFVTRVFGPTAWWPYLIILVAGAGRVLATALWHYGRPREKA